MSSITRKCVNVALFLTCLGFCLPANSQTKTTKAPGASVSGRVTIRGKGAPGIVVGLRVSNVGPQSGPSYKATTDHEGTYRISDVPAGNYRITPMAPAYVGGGPDSAGNKGILLADGETVQDIDFALVPGGVVTGKVTDAEGRPLIEERVYLVSADAAERPELGPRDNDQTDDRGIYRIFGIRAGRYKVAVGRNDRSFFDSVMSARQIYKQSFYPNGNDSAKATIVEVGEGTEATNIDITVGRAEQTFAVSGRVIDGDSGQPVPNIRFGIRTVVEDRPGSSGGSFGSGAVSNGKGDFRLDNLMPGKYAVFMLPQANNDVWAEATPFEILDQDVTGLIVKAQKGAMITGGHLNRRL
jgi:Carboxypeptidase regulatory-like domain